ncbi:MAG: hypothetical protein ACM3O9_08465 [Methylocystaceae bacterium]
MFYRDSSSDTMMVVGALLGTALICLPFLCYMRRMSDALEAIAYGYDDDEFDDDDEIGCCGHSHIEMP